MSAGGAHVAGGIYHMGDGQYRIGLPDAALTTLGKLRVWTELTDTKCVADMIPVVAYDPLTKLVQYGESARYTNDTDSSTEDVTITEPS